MGSHYNSTASVLHQTTISSSTSFFQLSIYSTIMALRIIYPAYQPMEFSPQSLFGEMTCPFRPVMGKRRRMMSTDFVDKVFSDMFLSPYDVCAKQKSKAMNRNESNEQTPDTFTKKFQMRDFKPEDIPIRVTADKRVVVEAKQEVKEEKDGFQSYQLIEFKQSVDVPENVNIEKLTSSLNEQGLLTISAPLLALLSQRKKKRQNFQEHLKAKMATIKRMTTNHPTTLIPKLENTLENELIFIYLHNILQCLIPSVCYIDNNIF